MPDFENKRQFTEQESQVNNSFDQRELQFGSPSRLRSLRQSIEAQKLPVVESLAKLEQGFDAAISQDRPFLLSASPGSGKTLYAPLAMQRALQKRGMAGRITILEPRRDATAMAGEGIAAVGGSELGKEVGFSTSEEKRFNRETAIRVITPGIFLRWLKNGWLNKGEVDGLILDEIHDPSLDYQQIFGLMKLAQQNGTLPATLLTSATPDLKKFQEYLGNILKNAKITCLN